ncbi:MAG: hypothetical protein ACN2B6_04740 [Rickettsiales bacterium]
MKYKKNDDYMNSATILRFPRKRGRPKTIKPEIDMGTPELIRKRAIGETAEALDLCLEREIISREQHWSGMHLRWLYTLRYGAPGARAIDPTHLGGTENKLYDLEWRKEREQEYMEAIKILHEHNHAALLLSLCVYNERPPFLKMQKRVTKANATKIENVINDLRTGFDSLLSHWKTTAPSKIN